MKNSTPFAFFLGLTFVTCPCLTNAQTQDKVAEIDKIFSWVKPNEPGCAVAASENGKLAVNKAYGSADLEREVPLSTNSVFDAGSVRKQFVAAAILLLVEDGKIALTDDIRKYISQCPITATRSRSTICLRIRVACVIGRLSSTWPAEIRMR